VYEKALSDYRWARVKRFLGLKDELVEDDWGKNAELYRFGLCWWLYNRTNIRNAIEHFPELSKQRPANSLTKDWWFTKGELTPRIKVLKAAIRLTKHKMRSYE
jgi:hypothetical protein